MPENRHSGLRSCKSTGTENHREKGGLSRLGPYIVAVVAGVVLTARMIPVAEQQRGYAAVGGEYLFAPLFVLAIIVAQWVYAVFKEVWDSDAEFDGGEE